MSQKIETKETFLQLVWLWMSRRRLSPQLLEVVRGWFHLVPHTKEQLRPAAHLAARARAVVMEGGTHTLRWTLGCIDMIVAQ